MKSAMSEDLNPNVTPAFSSDGTTVWIQIDTLAYARFGRNGWEMRSADGSMTHSLWQGSVSGVQDWREFTARLLDSFNLATPKWVTPHRIAKDLGYPEGYDVEAFDPDPNHVFLIPVGPLEAKFSPFLSNPWQSTPITREHVSFALAEAKLAPRYIEVPLRENLDRDWDSQRIAYFVQNPQTTPIVIEFIDPNEPDFVLLDGYHRLAAAIFRMDPQIIGALRGYLDANLRHAAFPGLIPYGP